MSQKPAPVQIVLSDSFYEIAAQRRADQNARLASQGLRPADDESPFISESQAKAEAEAEAKQRGIAPVVLLLPGIAGANRTMGAKGGDLPFCGSSRGTKT